jgi:hypothetical protein
MANSVGPTSPSRPTVKRLFAVSGNRCAFPKCHSPLVDPNTGSILGEICHIKGEKIGTARYDGNQTHAERQSFENLLLLCGIHHKIIDDNERTYPYEFLVKRKKSHEATYKNTPPLDDATMKRFVAVAINNCRIHGSVVTSHGQTGGQTAHVINNYQNAPNAPQPDEAIQLEGKLEVATGLELMHATGCPGLQLTVICRSVRAAKIKSAFLFVEGDDFLSGFQVGFGNDLGYTPVEGTRQTLAVKLIPLSQPNSPEGYIVERDGVCRFFYPLPLPPTTLALRAQPEDVSMGVEFFDGSERTLLRGRAVQDVLETLYEVYRNQPGHLKLRISVSVRGTSKTPPNVNMQGKVNQHYAPMAEPGPMTPPKQEGATTAPAAAQRSRRKGKTNSKGTAKGKKTGKGKGTARQKKST